MCVRPRKRSPLKCKHQRTPNVTTAIGLGGVMRLGGIFKSYFDMINTWIHIIAGFGSYLSGHR